MDLLNLCLTSTYFQYNGKHYKQLHETAMGSPVSVFVAEIVMQNIEERYYIRHFDTTLRLYNGGWLGETIFLMCGVAIILDAHVVIFIIAVDIVRILLYLTDLYCCFEYVAHAH